MLSTNIKDWSEIHVFYNAWLNHLTSDDDTMSKLEMNWREALLRNTPNGSLFVKNSLFEQLQQNEVYLAHLTPNLHNILRDNLIYPSGGCLVGSIYCTPVTKRDDEYRLHNLGSFIYSREVPRIAKVIPQILLIKVQLLECCRNRLIGVDYLRLGKIHFELFRELEYLLSGEERYELEKTCIARIQELLPLLILVQGKILKQKVDQKLFFTLFYEQIKRNPILAYLLFETFCEFTVLYQKSKKSEKWKEEGEVYSWHFKNSVFKLTNDSFFNLKSFQPKIVDIFNYLKNEKCIDDLTLVEVESFFFDRLSLLLYTRLWSHNCIIQDWRKLIFSFDSLSDCFKPLLGHIIHRELRNFGRYPNFYYYFDQLKALEAWNYWNHSNIAVPFNGLIPKGEIGINPAFPNLKFEVFQTNVFAKNSEEIFVEPTNKIKVRLVPRLIDLKYTTLRNKHHEKNGDSKVN